MSNKFPRLLTGLLLTILSSPLVAHGDASFEAFTGAVVGNKVRLRTQPNLEGHVVRETSMGELFAVTEEKEGFYGIRPPKESKGYVFRTFVLEGVVEGERVNIRLYPDVDAPIVGQLHRGDKIEANVCSVNNKWLEIDLPATSHFYIAKEYVEKKGAVGMIAEMEKRHHEATHLTNAAFLYAQAQMQKPFAEIDFESINDQLGALEATYGDFADIAEKVYQAHTLLQDLYLQRKLAFLEEGTQGAHKAQAACTEIMHKLANLGIALRPVSDTSRTAHAANQVVGLSALEHTEELTDKMLSWQPLEEALFHLWAASHPKATQEDFYQEQTNNAIVVSGILEACSRPVKNRPGDFLLRSEHAPAFLYSTRVNLEKYIGQKVTLQLVPRPNNNFAFRSYYVLGIE